MQIKKIKFLILFIFFSITIILIFNFQNLKIFYNYIITKTYISPNFYTNKNKFDYKDKNTKRELAELAYYFTKNEKQITFKEIYDENFLFENSDEEFNLRKLKFRPNFFLGEKAYITIDNDNLYIINGKGQIFFSELKNLNSKEVIFKKIENNLSNILGIDYLLNFKDPIKNILFSYDNLYVSVVSKSDKCFKLEIFKSKLNYDYLNFSKIFENPNCNSTFNNQAGGVMAQYKNEKIFVALGEFGALGEKNPYDVSQDIKNLKGNIILLDTKNFKYETVSYGHRNPQGIYYDNFNDVLINSEHGPQGGDEINLNFSIFNEIENFGYGQASYGYHYKNKFKKLKKNYEIMPLKKTHKKHGFKEPIVYFNPSIAPTGIALTNKFFNKKNQNVLLLGSLGKNTKEGDMSLHKIVLDNNFNFIERTFKVLNERIRDLKYIENENIIIMYFETSSSIGILKKN